MLNNSLKKLHEWLFPPVCLVCGGYAHSRIGLCTGCEQSLPYLTQPCPTCALPYAGSGPCGQCQQRPPAMIRTRALAHYQQPIDRLILDLKYHRRLHVARSLGELMLHHWAGVEMRTADLIMPVPLHGRLRRHT